MKHFQSPSAYDEYFDRLRAHVGDERFEHIYARVFSFLLVAKEPIGLSHLGAWGVTHSDARIVLKDCSELVVSQNKPWQKETMYSLCNKESFSHFSNNKRWGKWNNNADRSIVNHILSQYGHDWSKADLLDPVQYYSAVHILAHCLNDVATHEKLLHDETQVNSCQSR